MAAESGREAASLKQLLLEKTGRFDFLQAVRLLRKIWPDRVPVGGDSDPRDEIVRFRSDTSSVFPISDVSDAHASEDGRPADLLVHFMGAATLASWGALPRRYCEEVHRLATREKNPVLRDFIDIFNHRMVSLFFRAREKNKPVLAIERGRDNAFEHTVFGVLGLGTPGLADRMHLDDRMTVGRAGLLAMRPISASALESVLRSIFHVPVSIEQFLPTTYEIEVDDRNALGRSNSGLGMDLYIGGEITLVQSKFRVRMGPLEREAYEEFLPHNRGFRRLSELVHFAIGEELDYEVQLSLAAPDVPALRIGEPVHGSPRLGWSTWIGSEERSEPAEDALIDPQYDSFFSIPSSGASRPEHATMETYS